MSEWRMALTCPQCGSEVEHINGTANVNLSIALVACGPCNRQFEVTVRLTPKAWLPAEEKERRAARTAA